MIILVITDVYNLKPFTDAQKSSYRLPVFVLGRLYTSIDNKIVGVTNIPFWILCHWIIMTTDRETTKH